MNDPRTKMEKLKSLIKIREDQFNQEMNLLAQMVRQKQELTNALKENQEKYIKGIDMLNRLRGSEDRANLAIYETTIDYLKEEWYRSYAQIKDITEREKIQRAKLAEAQKQLKGTNQLHDKFALEYRKLLGKREQKQLDEIAGMRFVRNQMKH